VNGLREGSWVFYYSEGQPWVKCAYQAGKLHGRWVMRYSDGTIEERGGYFQGKIEGQWTWYYPDGKIYARGGYAAGKKHGTWESFDSDGTLWWKGSFSQGEKHGLWEAWAAGKKVEEGYFSQGTRHGGWKRFYDNGKVHFEGKFYKGAKAAIWHEYDKNGYEIRSTDFGHPRPLKQESSLLHTNQKFLGIGERLRKELDPTFRLDRAGPFVIASEASKVVTDHCRTYTVLWVHDQMMRDFCTVEPPAGEKTIYLFRTKKSYRDHALQWYGASPIGSAGFATQDALLVDISSGRGTLVHELIHAYLHSDFPFIPIWFDEGLASLFEQSAEVNKRITGLLNWRLSILKDAVKKETIIPLNLLTMLDREEFNGDGVELHYAEARYLCYYLQELGLLRAFYREFRNNSLSDPQGRRTLLQILRKNTLEEVQADWLNFIRKLVRRGQA